MRVLTAEIYKASLTGSSLLVFLTPSNLNEISATHASTSLETYSLHTSPSKTMTSLQAVVPRPNRRIPNPYYVADGVDATLDLLETGLLALVEVLGFNLENNAEATAVRYGLYIQLHKG